MSYYLVYVIIYLKTEKLEALELFYKNSSDNMVRKCSQCILLSHQKQTITDLKKIFGTSRRMIERWFDGWEQSGVDSLQMDHGRGAKTRLKGYEGEVTEQVEIQGRNLKNILNYFKEKHNIIICKQCSIRLANERKADPFTISKGKKSQCRSD